MAEEASDAQNNSKATDSAQAQPRADDASKADYDIGYRKPPKATQFKKGRSGNPRGSKKKPQIDDLRTVIETVLAESIKIRDGEKVRSVSKLEAMMRVQRVNALKGDPKAVKAMYRLAQKAGLFSRAQLRGFMVLDPAGDADEQRILKAFHDAKQPLTGPQTR
jgi:hypothetical protein